MVVQDIDSKKQDDVNEPSAYRNPVLSEKSRRPTGIELGDIAQDRYEDKLDKRQQGPLEELAIVMQVFRESRMHTTVRLKSVKLH